MNAKPYNELHWKKVIRETLQSTCRKHITETPGKIEVGHNAFQRTEIGPEASAVVKEGPKQA